MLDMLPPLDEVPHALAPTPSTNLTVAKRLSRNYGAVYCVHAYGGRIFCGLHTGHVQQWQCPLSGDPVCHEWRAHSSTVYALCVVGRVLLTGSRDHLVRLWDLQTLVLIATFPGHQNSVRSLAGGLINESGYLLAFSGSYDHTIRVWDMSSMRPFAWRLQLRGHKSAVRSLVMKSNNTKLCSASKEGVWVWETATLMHTHTLRTRGLQAYSMAMCYLEEDCAEKDTLYVGCEGGKILVWKLRRLIESSGGTIHSIEPYDDFELKKRDGGGRFSKIRGLGLSGSILCAGLPNGRLRVWDIGMKDHFRHIEYFDRPGHTAGIRSISVDANNQLVYTAADDRSVFVWQEGDA